MCERELMLSLLSNSGRVLREVCQTDFVKEGGVIGRTDRSTEDESIRPGSGVKSNRPLREWLA